MLLDFLQWFSNLDWTAISAIATVVAVVIALFSNLKAQKQTQIQIDEMRRQFAEANRPRINIYFDSSPKKDYFFVVENIGTEPAFNISLGLSNVFMENMKSLIAKQSFGKVNAARFYLAPQQKVIFNIGCSENFNEIAEAKLEFNVQYNDKFNKEFSEEISIDINQYRDINFLMTPIEGIRTDLQNIKEEITKLSSHR